MSSVWVRTRATRDGGRRYRVEYRLGGRESKIRYGGSFKTRRAAIARKGWIVGELASLRVPDVRLLDRELPTMPTLAEAADRWRASRVESPSSTRVLHRVALDRVLPMLGTRHVDELKPADVAAMVVTLAEAGYKRETISKSVTYLGADARPCGCRPEPRSRQGAGEASARGA